MTNVPRSYSLVAYACELPRNGIKVKTMAKATITVIIDLKGLIISFPPFFYRLTLYHTINISYLYR